jgi:hypothetical protein
VGCLRRERSFNVMSLAREGGDGRRGSSDDRQAVCIQLEKYFNYCQVSSGVESAKVKYCIASERKHVMTSASAAAAAAF